LKKKERKKKRKKKKKKKKKKKWGFGGLLPLWAGVACEPP
jgi:hypothetical protein